MNHQPSVIQSLELNHPFRTILEASIHRLKGQIEKPVGQRSEIGNLHLGDNWYFQVHIDNGSELVGTDEAGPWTRTAMTGHTSRIYLTYDEAAAELNHYLEAFYTRHRT